MRKKGFVFAFPSAFAAAALLCAAVSVRAAERTLILLKDGSWVDCETVQTSENGYRALSQGKAIDLRLAAIDPVSVLMLKARLLENRPEQIQARERYDLAQSLLSAGLPALGRKQILALAEEKPALRPVAEIWIGEYPVTVPGASLAEGIEAFTAGRPLKAYQSLNAVTSHREASPGQLVIASRFLNAIVRMLEEKNQLDPGSGGGDDPVKNGKLRRIRAMIIDGDKALTDAFKWRDAGDRGRTARGLENSCLALDSAIRECGRFAAESPGPLYEEQIEGLKAWAGRVLFDVKMTAAEHHLAGRDPVAAEKAVDEALALDPESARARELKERLTAPGRKRG